MDAPEQSSLKLIRAYLDAVIRRDVSAVDRFFDRDVEYIVNGTVEPFANGLPGISADCCHAR